MPDGLSTLEAMVSAALAVHEGPTPSDIRKLIGDLRPMFQVVTDEEAESLARRLEERLGVTMTIGAVLTQQGFAPWLEAAREGIDPYYWDRYQKHLQIHRNFPASVVSTLDRTTDRVLGLLGNPAKEGQWDRRGMVVGHVQSGKTSNYAGLLCKAADAGYKLIVVIAGLHNNLRNQTQERIDEGFVGRDSSGISADKRRNRVGVGKIDATRKPVTFTTAVSDFNKASAKQINVSLQNLKDPVVFVIKKNASTLRNLLEWLREHSADLGSETVSSPMLLIDDEADNASINVKYDKGEVSRINGQIRDLLNMFDRSCYVGYTATPFANIFIDPDSDDEMLGADLFPRDFIVSLDPPSNYFGPTRVFGDQADEVVRPIEDNQDLLPLRHKIDAPVPSLPNSMLEAVRGFVVARAIRLARGHGAEHCSMLVNASRFVNVQSRIASQLHLFLRDIQNSVRLHAALPDDDALKDPEMQELQRVWTKEFALAGTPWDTVRDLLHKAAAPIKVVQVNSRSSDSLSYRDHSSTGLNVIAVGGYSLSRGLTLEGLMVSYFLRNSMMYDTLMQMGRWFGYRPGYDDLCRVWMPESAVGWYTHIAESIELLRDELRSMDRLNATPQEFGLKVRSHPDSLIITARNKMGSGERVVRKTGLSEQCVETWALRRDQESLEKNRIAAGRLADDLRGEDFSFTGGPAKGGYLVTGDAADQVLAFLRDFRNHEGSVLTDGDPIRRYIEERKNDELKTWDIFFVSLQSDKGTEADDSLGVTINCQTRSKGGNSNEQTLLITEKQRVLSRGAEKTGLSPDERRDAERKYEAKNPGKRNYSDKFYRAERKRPLLLVHLLLIQDPATKAPDPSFSKPVVAWSLSFPPTTREEDRVEFVFNTTGLRDMFGDDDDDEGVDE
jgi:Z1 domain